MAKSTTVSKFDVDAKFEESEEVWIAYRPEHPADEPLPIKEVEWSPTWHWIYKVGGEWRWQGSLEKA